MTRNGLVYLISLVSAAMLATGSVVQQRVAAQAPAELELRLRLLLWLVRRPMWLFGAVVGTVGQLLSVLALAFGSIVLVQPLLVVQLLFALPVAARVDRVRIPGRDWVGAAATTAGLVVFLAVGNPSTGGSVEPGALSWIGTAVLSGVVAAALIGASRRLHPTGAGAALASAAGIAFALQAALAQTAFVHLDRVGLGATVVSWLPYTTAAVAILGQVLVQSAYKVGPLLASYPVVSAVTPLASIALGVWVLGGDLRRTPGALAAEALGLLVMTAGIVVMARSPLVSRPAPAPTTEPTAAPRRHRN